MRPANWAVLGNVVVLVGLMTGVCGYVWLWNRHHAVPQPSLEAGHESLFATSMKLDAGQPRREETGRTENGSGGATFGSPGNPLLKRGDAMRGERVFFEKPEAMCHKCHQINGKGGGVGPDLTRIGAAKSREYLLESLLEPDAVVAEGFDTKLVQTLDGNIVFGVVREQSNLQLRLVDVEGRSHVILIEDIEDQRPGRSAMPSEIQKNLTPEEIRDLVEYLASQRGN